MAISSLSRAIRLLQTLRYLKPRQVVYQLYYRFKRPATVHVDTVGVTVAEWATPWSGEAYHRSSTSDLTAFQFLGESHCIDIQNDWNNPSLSKLWLYNLHYLDELNAQGSEERIDLCKQLINAWVAWNPEKHGNGWEPYVISLRAVNWIKWCSQYGAEKAWDESLAKQFAFLSKRIEYHILANHLFANGKALVFGGAYFSAEQAKKWMSLGLKIVDSEVEEQFLADGGHYELSPMYHSILLWDLCDLIELARCSGDAQLQNRVPQWKSIVVKGIAWLESMIHPDGEISFFNDAAMGIAPTLHQLKSYAQKLKIEFEENSSDGLVHLNHTGYAVVSEMCEHKLIADIGKVGPDYQPGHAHADTLSFELSLWGKRVFVNSGTSQYGLDAERLRQRSTRAHNTVEIENANSSDVWAGFRVGRRARSTVLKCEQDQSGVLIKAFHDGYRFLKGKNIHHRTWRWSPSKLIIEDQIDGGLCGATAFFHLHPDVSLGDAGGDSIALTFGDKQVEMHFEGLKKLDVQDSTWHPSFGVSVKNKCLAITFENSSLKTTISW